MVVEFQQEERVNNFLQPGQLLEREKKGNRNLKIGMGGMGEGKENFKKKGDP